MLEERDKRHRFKPLTKTVSNGLYTDHLSGRSSPSSRGIDNKSNDNNDSDRENNKLFNSHSSIYNALTNPELELSPNFKNHELSKFPSTEFYIDESWQNISNDSILRTFNNSPAQQLRPASLLSITTDENEQEQIDNPESTIIVDSMVFETDEEDDFKPSFIMPKVSMSHSSSNKLRLCVISNDLNISNLVSSNSSVDVSDINIRSTKSLPHDINNCKLIFIINDGSVKLLEFLNEKLPKKSEFSNFPKILVINLITCNFFSNLFDLINNFKPFQIWKASSLKDRKLIEDFNRIVDLELSYKLDESNDDMNSSVYTSLIPNSNRNYKFLERQFKKELSIQTNNIDPLSLKRLSIFNTVINRCFDQPQIEHKPTFSYNYLYVLASFTIGISLGFGIANGTAKYYAQLSNKMIQEQVVVDPSSAFDYLDQIKVIRDEFKTSLINIINCNIFDDFSKLFFGFMSDLKSTSSWLIDCIYGGFTKILAAF